MNADLVALFEPWWPLAAAAGVGLVLGWLLWGRRTSKDAEPRPAPDEPKPFPLRPPVEPTLAPVQPSAEAAPSEPAVPPSPKLDAPEPFAQFESKLREWQTYATDAAAQSSDQPSIDDWDDLMDVDGIDLGIARFLYAENIHTFEQIAAMTAAELRAVLDRAGSSYATVDPSSWPEAARRAAMAR